MLTNVDSTLVLLAAICLGFATAHVYAVRSDRASFGAAAKVCASTAFIFFAVESGALISRYGLLVLAALALSWIGDLLLLSRQTRMFMGGIASFLFAHIFFAAAFLSQPVSAARFAIAAAVTAVAGYMLYRWLRPKLDGIFSIAVPLYIAVIMIMVSCSIAITGAAASWFAPVGAVIFAVSDVFVARDRFIKQSFANKFWGIPLYYIAQLLLAASVSAARS